MIIQKYLVTYYPKLFFECKNKSELIKYFFRKIFNDRIRFSKDVIIKSNGVYYNCGRLMDNCRVACSEFEKGVIPEINKVHRGVFIDVGASIGKFSLIKAMQFWDEGIVYCIEANRNSARLIKKSIKLNGLDEPDNVRVLNFVCSDKIKIVDFYQRDYYPSSSSTIKISDSKTSKRETITLDNIFKNTKEISLIKIDVEGEDLNVLKGAINIIKLHKPKIIFEAWGEKGSNEMKDFFKPLGYKINKIDIMNYVGDFDDGD